MQERKAISRKKTLRIIKIGIVGAPVAVVAILTIYMAIQAASYGAKMKFIEDKIIKIDRENREISSQLVSGSSLGGFSEKAEELGFIKPTNILYIESLEPVAKLP